MSDDKDPPERDLWGEMFCCPRPEPTPRMSPDALLNMALLACLVVLLAWLWSGACG